MNPGLPGARRAALLLVLLAPLAATAADTAAPPAARETNTVDHLFGLTLPDPYRWMEGESNAEFQTWMKAQAAHTRAQLEASEQLAGWQKRLQAVSKAATINRLQRRVGSRIFFLRIEAGRRPVLMVREADAKEHKERTLLDPNAMAEGGQPASITEFSPSPNGKLIAVNVDRGGSEVTTVSLINVDSGATEPDTLDNIWGEFAVSWMTDSSGFSYTQMAPKASPEADPMLNMRVRVHRLGEPVKDDPIVLAAGMNPRMPLMPVEFPAIDFSNSSEWAVATASGARPEFRVCVARKTEAMKPGAPWNCLARYDDKVQGYGLHGSTLMLQSAKGAPHRRVLALDLSTPKPRLSDAKVALPESREAVVTGLTAARDGLYVRRMTDGIDSFLRLPWQGGPAVPVAMPFTGAAFLMWTEAEADGLVYTLQGWTQPRQAFAYDPASGRSTDLNLGASSPADYSGITTLETEAVSADGTHVPLSIIYKRDLVRDGRALALLDGYGSYGSSQQPYFSPTLLEWVQAGHVYAVAHVRGGGEKGDAWWQGGKGPNKHKGVEDFVACAKQLATLKFSKHERTAASGASAGGLLVGGAITAAPKQFGAAVIHAGMLNPVRLLAGSNGANQIAEVGDPRNAVGLKSIAAMDPVQRVKDGVAYPAVLLAVGLNDSRVSPWESGKFGARLAKATRSGKPVWFRNSGDQGHFSGSLSEEAAEAADTYTFFEMQLGQLGQPAR